ncbi:MAG: hypothetical protein M1503_06580 [Thaumarchaeota archaeon]|nr:hypothetical protein [Nitrososphaerota archaeon]MCL5317908.1 hypothetical protein [Nitrososphaerota archaeon]
MRFADTLVLFIIGMVLFSPLALAATLTVVPNKTTYVPNDKLVVTGTASASSSVTIKVIKPNSDIYGIEQGNTNAAGAYNVTVLAWPATNSTATPFGTYTVAVTDVLTGATAQATVKFAQSGPPTTTTTTGNTTKTVTVTVNSTITKTTTRNTTVTSTSTSTTTSVSSTTVTSTTSVVTTSTSVSTQVSTVTSTAMATTTVLTTTTATKTTTGPAQTTTMTSTVSTGLPAEVTYAAVGIAVIAIIAAALLATRRRR